MTQFLYGASAMGLAAASLFFLRFYRRSADRLFLLFAGAFAMLAVNRVALAMLEAPNEARPIFYVIRLLAFVVILVAIVDKNRQGRS
jgi:hypothetical protein